MKELWEKHLLKMHCQGGFAKAEIYPFDSRAVSKEKLLSPLLSVNSQNSRTSSIALSDSNDTLFRRDQRTEIHLAIDRSSSCVNLSTNGE